MSSNEEIRRLTEQLLITSVFKARRLQWAGHVVQAPPKQRIRQVLDGRPTGPRFLEKPWLRWEDNVSIDAEILGISECEPPANIDAVIGLRAL